MATFAAPSPPGLPPHTQWPGSGDRADPSLATFLAWQERFRPDAVRAHEDMRTGATGLLDRIGPSVLLTHSFGGGFGWLALSERPVAGQGDRRGRARRAAVRRAPGARPLQLRADAGAASRSAPGTTRRSSTACRSRSCRPRAPASSRRATLTAEYLRSCGAAVDELRLGELGIHGNGHAMMLEKNNAEVAAVITDWIVKHT